MASGIAVLDAVLVRIEVTETGRIVVTLALSEVQRQISAVLSAFSSADSQALLGCLSPPQFEHEQRGQEQGYIALARECEERLMEDELCLELKAPLAVVGDLHGCWVDLIVALSRALEVAKEAPILFLGDYIDRGEEQLQVLLLLMALKIAHPKRIFLLRGNHEIRHHGGKGPDCFRTKYKDMERLVVDQLYGVFNFKNPTESHSTFAAMSLCARITAKDGHAPDDKAILCMHAGIGKTDDTLVQQVKALRREWKLIDRASIVTWAPVWRFPKESGDAEEFEKLAGSNEAVENLADRTYSLLMDLVWSDPIGEADLGSQACSELPYDVCTSGRNNGDSGCTPIAYCFGPIRLAKFFEANELVALVRGHEADLDLVQKNGYAAQEVHASTSGVIVTVHTGRYQKNLERGAILAIASNLSITAHSWRFVDSTTIPFETKILLSREEATENPRVRGSTPNTGESHRPRIQSRLSTSTSPPPFRTSL